MAQAKQFIKLLLSVAVLAVAFAGVPAQADDPQPQHGMGCLLSPPGDYPRLETPMIQAQGLVSRVDLSSDLPPVGDQGIDPTCTLWAVAYYYKTFQEQRERAWGVDNPAHQFSPGFLYSLSTNCYPLQPVAIPTAMEIVKNKGCATLTTIPWVSYSQCRAPSAEELEAARPFRALSYGYLFMHPGNADIYRLKAHLAKGDPFVLSIPVYDSFYYYTGETPVIGLPAAGEKLWGHHAILIVGYDDSLKAFKLVNSWGTRWGLGGYGYLSYEFVRAKAWEAWAMVDLINSTPVPTPTPAVTPEPVMTVMPFTIPTATPTVLPTPQPTPSPLPFRSTYTLVLQQGLQGYQGVTDTYIESNQPTRNYDKSRALRVNDNGSASTLLRFDLSTIPVTAEIVEATLELYAVLAAPAQNLIISSFELVRPWVSKEVNWNQAHKEQPWTMAGCNDIMSDRLALPVSTEAMRPGQGWRAIDVTEVVRRWVSKRSSNNGLILQGQGMTNTSYIFLSSEHWSSSLRPKLTIKYRQ